MQNPLSRFNGSERNLVTEAVKKASREAKKRQAERALQHQLQQARVNLERQREDYYHYHQHQHEITAVKRIAMDIVVDEEEMGQMDETEVSDATTQSALEQVRTVQASCVEKAREAVRQKASLSAEQNRLLNEKLQQQIDRLQRENKTLQSEKEMSRDEVTILRQQIQRLELKQSQKTNSSPEGSLSMVPPLISEREDAPSSSAPQLRNGSFSSFHNKFRQARMSTSSLPTAATAVSPATSKRSRHSISNFMASSPPKVHRPFFSKTLFTPTPPFQADLTDSITSSTFVEESHRTLYTMNEGMQSVLYELQTEICDLKETNQQLLKALQKYRDLVHKLTTTGSTIKRLSKSDRAILSSPLGASLQITHTLTTAAETESTDDHNDKKNQSSGLRRVPDLNDSASAEASNSSGSISTKPLPVTPTKKSPRRLSAQPHQEIEFVPTGTTISRRIQI